MGIKNIYQNGSIVSSKNEEHNEEISSSLAIFHKTDEGSINGQKQKIFNIDRVIGMRKICNEWKFSLERIILQNGRKGFNNSQELEDRLELTSAVEHLQGSPMDLNYSGSGDAIYPKIGSNSFVWDWTDCKQSQSFKSSPTNNILQAKFIDISGGLDFIYYSWDGEVRRAVVPPSGSSSMSVSLYNHSAAVWCIVVPESKHELISAGMDSVVKHFDLRTNAPTIMQPRCISTKSGLPLRFLSIDHHPNAPEFCLNSYNGTVVIYDKRNSAKALHNIMPRKESLGSSSSALYSQNCGSIALHLLTGTYRYDSRNCQYDEYLQSSEIYSDEYDIRDNGNIFICSKKCEAEINSKRDDQLTVICLETHLHPLLHFAATDYKVKILTSESVPKTNTGCSSALKERIRLTVKTSILLDAAAPQKRDKALRNRISICLAAAAAAVALTAVLVS